MAISPKVGQDHYRFRESLRAGAIRLSITLAAVRVRLVILLLAVGFSLWQLYAFGWVPLVRQTALPAGLINVSAELDVATLTKIRDARAARLQHRPNLFSNADQFFAVSSPGAVP